MKKIISVLLAALMLVSCFAVSSFAAVEKTGECTCEDHNDVACHCCLYCPKLSTSYVTSCAKDSLGSDVKYVCCHDCTGIVGCPCGCPCCDVDNEDIDSDDSTLDELVPDETKESFVDGFQSILKVISDFFDDLWEAIRTFLRLDDVIGKGDDPTKA